jgi:enoyl-CoA hydratase
VVAAVNGHAIAGGCVLVCAADWRIMARGRGRIGALELKVGVPFPAAALEIVRFAVPPRELPPMIYRGMTSEPEEALARGLVDELVDAGELTAVARARAEEMAALPRQAFALAKEQIRADASERIERGTVDQGMDVAELWRSPETRAAIRRWVDRTLGPR